MRDIKVNYPNVDTPRKVYDYFEFLFEIFNLDIRAKKLRHFLAKQSLYKDCYISAVRVHIGEGDGTPLQYSCLENLMDRGAW